MPEWIEHSELVHMSLSDYCFDLPDEPRSGYGFPCTKEGVLKMGEIGPEAMVNLLYCCFGQDHLIEVGVRTHSWTYRKPGVIRCDCGNPLTLHDAVTNVCEATVNGRPCNRYYNGCGQGLVNPRYWEDNMGW